VVKPSPFTSGSNVSTPAISQEKLILQSLKIFLWAGYDFFRIQNLVNCDGVILIFLKFVNLDESWCMPEIHFELTEPSERMLLPSVIMDVGKRKQIEEKHFGSIILFEFFISLWKKFVFNLKLLCCRKSFSTVDMYLISLIYYTRVYDLFE